MNMTTQCIVVELSDDPDLMVTEFESVEAARRYINNENEDEEDNLGDRKSIVIMKSDACLEWEPHT